VTGEEAEDPMAGFRAASRGAHSVTARFAAAQAGIIRNLVSQVAELVGGRPLADLPPVPGNPGHAAPEQDIEALAAQLGLSDAAPPDDPALARLLPDAYRDDPQAAAEFRRYTEQGLRDAKVAAARTVLATLPPGGGRIRLTEPQSQDWLRALNDVRLALSVRLGVTDEFDDEVAQITPTDPRYAYVWVYQWLAYLQETLVEALS
jgi:hypothetical protein